MKNKKGDYIPSNKMEFIAWLLNFLKKLTKYVNHYGINEEQIKIAQPQADVFKEDMAIELEILNAKLAQFKKSEKDRKAIEKTCRKIANVIKADFDYTEDIGREFGIIGPEKEMDEENAMPLLKLTQKAHGWELSFGLQDYFDGVNIYRQRPDAADYTYLATDTRSPYVDNEPMVNGTEYYAVFIIGDTEVGKRSAIMQVSI